MKSRLDNWLFNRFMKLHNKHLDFSEQFENGLEAYSLYELFDEIDKRLGVEPWRPEA